MIDAYDLLINPHRVADAPANVRADYAEYIEVKLARELDLDQQVAAIGWQLCSLMDYPKLADRIDDLRRQRDDLSRRLTNLMVRGDEERGPTWTA
jgi:hypothetical protein